MKTKNLPSTHRRSRAVASFILCAVILLMGGVALPVQTVSAETYGYDGYWQYTVSDGQATITTCQSSATGAIAIPSVLDGCPVTSIGDYAFSGCTGLTSIRIPDSVTSIGDYAFSGCTGLTGITIPDSVTKIRWLAFEGCIGLTDMIVDPDNPVYHSATNCLIETATKELICGCKGSVIPNDESVTLIGSGAFRGCTGLTSISIPNSVTSIGFDAFDGCTGLTSISIPDSVTEIVWYAFYGCTGLNTVYYCGTEEEWKKISIGNSNDSLTSANRIYHRGDWIVVTPATCTENGLERRVCEECGETLERMIPAHHTEQVLRTMAPTCTEQGYDLVKCTVCGTRYTTHYTAALGHTFGNWQTITAPTCTQSGEQKRVCTVCGAAETTGIAATGHTYDWEVIVPATCTQTGERRRVCTVCGEHGETETAPALGHDYRLTETVAATCVNDGFYLYTCTRCGGTRRDVIPAAGHYFVDGECVDCGIREAEQYFPSPTQRENAVVVAISGGQDVAPASSDTGKFDGQVESGMQIADHFNLTGTNGQPTVFNVQGADDSTQGYFLYLAPGATTLEKIPATFANGTATATFPGDGEVVFVSNLGAGEVYIFTEGMGQEWVKGSGKDATFKTNGDYSDFTGIQVDGKDVDAANYTSKNGSTYITLKAAYLETLEHGKHTLTAVYTTHNDPVTDFNISSFEWSLNLSTGELLITGKSDLVSSPWSQYKSSIKTVTIEDGITSIGICAFRYCRNLTSITIPNSVTTIGDRAFYGCTGLTSITIPDSVTSIGDDAFYGCTGLKTVYYQGTMAQWDQISVGDGNIELMAADVVFSWQGISEADAPYDMNGDGVLNALDLVAIKKRLIGGTAEETPDINGDGAVNVLDAIALKKRLSSRS